MRGAAPSPKPAALSPPNPEGLCAGRTPRCCVSVYRASRHRRRPILDTETAAAELRAADEALRAAKAAAEPAQSTAATAAAAVTAASTAATVPGARPPRDREERIRHGAVTNWRRCGPPFSDEAVAEQATADAEEQRKADEAVADLTGRYAAAEPDAVEAELAAAAAVERDQRRTRRHQA